jgi:hypothetical protein
MQGKGHLSTASCEAHFRNDKAIYFLHDLDSYLFDSRITWPSPSSHTTDRESTQSLTERSTRNLLGGKGRSARKDENLTAICEPTV